MCIQYHIVVNSIRYLHTFGVQPNICLWKWFDMCLYTYIYMHSISTCNRSKFCAMFNQSQFSGVLVHERMHKDKPEHMFEEKLCFEFSITRFPKENITRHWWTLHNLRMKCSANALNRYFGDFLFFFFYKLNPNCWIVESCALWIIEENL